MHLTWYFTQVFNCSRQIQLIFLYIKNNVIECRYIFFTIPRLLRTKMIVLRHHPKSFHNHPETKGSHKAITFNSHLHDQIMTIEHSDRLHKLQSHGDGRSIGSLQRYSVPVEESTWKPTRGSIEYIPLKHLGEDGDRISDVVHQAMDDSEAREAQTNLILPIGIKKLHNPQLRRPRAKYVYSKDGVIDSRRARKQLLLKSPPPWRNKSMFNFFEMGIRCHCQIP